MQKALTTASAAHRSLRTGLATLLLFGVAATAGHRAHAQMVASPVGTTWDCVLSGSGQKGIAFITFTTEPGSGLGSFSGYQILAPAVTGNKEIDGRNLAGGIGRQIEITKTNSAVSTNLFGFDQFEGNWNYDVNGKVIGHFAQVAGGGGSNPVTNSISFTAKVVPEKRLTLVASTPAGKVTYKGVAYTGTAPSFDGAWYGTKEIKQQWFTEFYTFTSVAESNPFPESLPDLSNYPRIYFTQDGIGPSYEIEGFAMVSSQKKAAFAFQSYAGTNGVLNASFGSLSGSGAKLKASSAGVESPDTTIRYTFRRPMGTQ
jgi:hypothetical protein